MTAGWSPEDERAIDDYKARLEAMTLDELLIESGCQPRATPPTDTEDDA